MLGEFQRGTLLSRKSRSLSHLYNILTLSRKSKTPARIKANLEGDFKLDAEDVKKIDGLDKKLRFNDPSEGFGWKFYADLDGKK